MNNDVIDGSNSNRVIDEVQEVKKVKANGKLGKCGRKTLSESGEIKDYKVLSAFTKSEGKEIEGYMVSNKLDNKSSFFNNVILDYIRKQH